MPWTVTFKDRKHHIPYKIDKSIANNDHGTSQLKIAFEKLESNSSLKFIERTNEERYMNFTHGSGCYSYIGQQEEIGPQDITLGHGCLHPHTIIHEVDLFF